MKLTGITVEEKAVVTVVATCGRAELAKSVTNGRKHWLFSGAFSSVATLRPLWCGCPGFPKVSK